MALSDGATKNDDLLVGMGEPAEVEEGLGASGRHKIVAHCNSNYAWNCSFCKDGVATPFARMQTSKFPNGALITMHNGASHLLVPRQSSRSSSLKWHLLPQGQEDAGVDKIVGAPEHIATLRMPQQENRPSSLLFQGVRYLLVKRPNRHGFYSVFRMANAMLSPNSDRESDLQGTCIGGIVCVNLPKSSSKVVITFVNDAPDILFILITYLAKYHADRTADSAALLTRFPRAVITAAVSAFSV